MAYIGADPFNKGIGLFSQDTFTGDGSTTTFDLTNVAPDSGDNEIQVFVDNVRQQAGSSNAFTLGQDGSGDLKRITFTAAPAASASIYVLNPGTKNVQQLTTVGDNTISTAKIQADAVTTAKILDGNVTRAKIEADAIDATKIADDAISEEHLDVTAITGHTELSAGAATNDQLLIFDTSASALKKISQTNLLNFPTISSVSPTNVNTGDLTGNHTFTITGTGFTGASAKLINSSGADVNFTSVTVDSDTQITGVVAKSSVPNSGEPYDVKVTAATGLQSTLENQINVNAQPVFVTSSGSIGNGRTGALSFSVNATDPESAGNVTFELQSGSFPPGLSLTNTAAEGGTAIISGTVTGGLPANAVVYNFVLRAVDAASNTSSRAFSIQINGATSQSFTSSGTFSVPSGVSTVDVLVVAGGGAGSVQHGGGGGAGGLIFRPGFSVTPGGTVSVTVGCGGSGQASQPSHPVAGGQTGQDSAFGTLTAKGGGGAGNHIAQTTGQNGGSGGGAGSDPGGGLHPGGEGIQPTQSGDSGAYGFGNDGGQSANPGTGPVYAGGGGGGAGAIGDSGSNSPGGPLGYGGQGGDGKAYTIADGTTSVYYAGGGGAGTHGSGTGPTDRAGGIGGQGGGGDGNITLAQGTYPTASQSGESGEANKGGGGGGNAAWGVAPGTSGGKGVVIVRY